MLCQKCSRTFELKQNKLIKQLVDEFNLDIDELTETQLKRKVNLEISSAAKKLAREANLSEEKKQQFRDELI